MLTPSVASAAAVASVLMLAMMLGMGLGAISEHRHQHYSVQSVNGDADINPCRERSLTHIIDFSSRNVTEEEPNSVRRTI